MKILNLFAGLGGNRLYWENHNITAVEINKKVSFEYKNLFPSDTVIIDDAYEFLKKHFQEYDFIWASPPCQSHSKLGKIVKPGREPDPRLYETISFLKNNFAGNWVVENVIPYYEPKIPYQKIGRHAFWSNKLLNNNFKEPRKDFNFSKGNGNYKEYRKNLENWLGFKIDSNIYLNGNHCYLQVYRNCVHPLLGNFILKQFENDLLIKK